MSSARPSVLFIIDAALARVAFNYFRSTLPAEAGGWDRLGLNILGLRGIDTANAEASQYMPDRPWSTVAQDVDPDAYDIIVFSPLYAPNVVNDLHMQINFDDWPHVWMDWIARRRRAGTRVLLEVDDYAHGWPELHARYLNERFTGKDIDKLVRTHERYMRGVDGLICSTAFTARQYRRFNRRTYTCLNLVECDEWVLPREWEDDRVRIGFYANTADGLCMLPEWLPAVERVMERHEDVDFMVLGVPELLRPLRRRFGDRCIARETTNDYAAYKEALAEIDIALAPVPHLDVYRGKTDQRWLHASALGIPTVADPWTYLQVIDGETGLLASDVDEAETQIERLAVDAELRERIGRQAQQDVKRRRDMSVGVADWQRAFRRVMNPPPMIGGGQILRARV